MGFSSPRLLLNQLSRRAPDVNSFSMDLDTVTGLVLRKLDGSSKGCGFGFPRIGLLFLRIRFQGCFGRFGFFGFEFRWFFEEDPFGLFSLI